MDGASRTDAGVHAMDQLIALSLRHPIRKEGLVRGLNTRLPKDIAVRSPVDVPLDFVPRFSTHGKIYRYQLISALHPLPMLERYVTRVRYDLDLEKMAVLIESWVGCHDFTSFAASNGQHSSAIRLLWKAELRRHDSGMIEFRFGGEGFLKQMVRNLVGTALEVGRGHWPLSRGLAVLMAQDRSIAGPTAPPQGLTLLKTLWPSES